MNNEVQKKETLTPEKRDAYYIASGFFNPKQVATVDKIESSLASLNIRFFSPRNESIPFFSETDAELKSMMTKLIFNNNLDSMDSCNKFIVNLQDEDQGTLFEYGYIVGRNISHSCNQASELARTIKVMNDKFNLEKLVNKYLEMERKIDPDFLRSGKDFEFMANLIKDEPSLNYAIEDNKLAILSIDDRDPINLFLMGYFYALEVPVVTYSRKNYGTNVMLVHSTYHCENEEELVELIQEMGKEVYSEFLAESGRYLRFLRLNKQTWDKIID